MILDKIIVRESIWLKKEYMWIGKKNEFCKSHAYS